MEWSIGKRIKSRTRERQQVQKRKKMELEASLSPPPKTGRRRRRAIDNFSDIEEIGWTVDPMAESSRVFSGFMASEDEKDEKSEREEEEEDDDDNEDEDEDGDEDYRMVESEIVEILSSSSSASSSDGEHNIEEKVITEKIGDNCGIADSTGMERKSSGKTRKNEKKMKQKPRKEQERVMKQQTNIVFTCAHCGNTAPGATSCDNSFTTPAARAADEDLNKLASTKVSRAKDSVSISSDRKSGKQQLRTEIERGELKGMKSEATKSSEWRVIGRPKDLDVFGLLVNSVWGDDKIGEEEEESGASPPKKELQEQEGKEADDEYDADGYLIVKPPPLVLNFKFGEEEPEPAAEISETEMENLRLFEELALLLKSGEVGVEVSSHKPMADEHPLACCENGNHELYLDLEIGLKCMHCGFVETEIRYMDVSE